MADEEPIAYTALTKGIAVLASDGTELGKVEHVQSDESLDLFDGIVVKTSEGLRFLTADKVSSITTAAVHAKVANVSELDAPHTGDAVFHDDPDQYQDGGPLQWFGRVFAREHWTRDVDKD